MRDREKIANFLRDELIDLWIESCFKAGILEKRFECEITPRLFIDALNLEIPDNVKLNRFSFSNLNYFHKMSIDNLVYYANTSKEIVNLEDSYLDGYRVPFRWVAGRGVVKSKFFRI